MVEAEKKLRYIGSGRHSAEFCNSAADHGRSREMQGDRRRQKRRRVGYQSVQILQRRYPHWPEAFRSDDVVPNGAKTRTHPCLVERDTAE